MLVVVSKTATGRSRRTTIMRCNKMSVAAAAICESANLRLPSLLYIHCFAVVVIIIFFLLSFLVNLQMFAHQFMHATANGCAHIAIMPSDSLFQKAYLSFVEPLLTLLPTMRA